MAPVRRVCDATARTIVPVAPNDQQPACGYIFTWCVRKVVAYHEVASFAKSSP